MSPRQSAERRKVIGIDVDIPKHNREAIEKHPLFNKIQLIEGSSIDAAIIERVTAKSRQYSTVLVVLDSNHTHDHIFAELTKYSELVSKNSYMIVLETVIEDMPDELFKDRLWRKGNNPKTTVHSIPRKDSRFEIDDKFDNKLLVSAGHNGYLYKHKN